MKQLYNKPFFLGAIFVVALSALTSVASVSADRDAWTWTDKSSSLPQRDSVNLTLSAERQGSWLLSDGRALLRFDGTTVTDLSQEARDHGLNSIKLLASDGRQWLVWNKPLDDRRGSLWLRDGENWADMTNVLPSSVETLEATGHDGQWYLNTTANGTKRLVFVNGTASIPQDVVLPLESTNNGHAAFINGRWFWIGEQTGHLMAWSINGLTMTALKGVPSSLPVLNVWSNNSSALMTTTDGLWSFDDSIWTNLSNQTKALGLATGSSLKAAYGGSSWMLISGTSLYRYDGSALVSKGTAKDRILSVSGGNGFAVTGLNMNGWTTLQSVDDAIAEAQVAPAPIATSNASGIANAIYGTDLRVEGIPTDLTVGDGMGFTFRATASDIVGMDRIEIYVNGARIRVCPGTECVFTTTYWANGLTNRAVVFQAKALNKLGAATQSRIITLNVRRDSKAGLTPITTIIPSLSKDSGTGISFASWMVPVVSSLPSGTTANYVVSSQDTTDGISTMNLWLNGQVANTCNFAKVKTQTTCEIHLSANDYPVGTDLFLNARITDGKGNAVWIPATTITRPAATSIATVPTQNIAPVESSGTIQINSPAFASRLTLSPDVTDIRRGGTLTVRAFGVDSLVGLDRIEISYGGQIRQICRYGVAMSEVKCELTIDAASYADNTSFSFVARAINTDGQEAWSNGRSVTIRAANWSPTPAGSAASTDGITRWSWLNPPTAQIEATQESTYSVGTWSANGIAKIDMVVNGATRKTCSFASGTTARDCAFIIRTGDWNHGQVVTVNARITDMKGHVAWTDASSVTISRAWWETLNTPGPYVTVSATKNDTFTAGDTLGFTLSGWSPNGANHLELFMNGARVMTCPSDMCRWTSPALSTDRVEYQARLVDTQGKETWTALYGLNKK
ncbi:MAG: hypothetical protein WCK01_03525 [Candidatus Uhrbacteria bacterium]